MFFKFSHKARLSLLSSFVVGLILAALFFGVDSYTRSSVLARERTELISAFRAFSSVPGEPFDVPEFREAHPDMSVTIYSSNGPRSSGPIATSLVKQRNILLFGGSVAGVPVVVASNFLDVERNLETVSKVLLLLWFPLVALVGAMAWFTTRSVFDPLERLHKQAESFSGTDLSQRLDTKDRAEFGAFAHQLNRFLDKIEVTAKREEQFAEDAAHELRTPLTILRTRLETTLLSTRTPQEYIAECELMLLEVERLSLIAEALLQSARAPVTFVGPTNIEQIVRTEISRFNLPDLNVEVTTEPAFVKITSEEVQIILNNLLSNAQRFAPKGSRIYVSLSNMNGDVILRVRDEGPGVDPKLTTKIFERFSRAEDSRNRVTGGAGIGLSVCKRIVETRAGTLTYSAAPEGGAIFTATFPAASSNRIS